MADSEQILLNHYNLASLYPSEWPAEKDESDPSGDEQPAAASPSARNSVRRSKSRYSALDRRSSQRTSVPGSQRNKEGVENLVQKDEPDPLGEAPSVVQRLRQRRLPVEDDLKLRNRFLLSSTTFSPSLFLAQVHHDASTESLLQGLDFLSRSIEKKSASLKVLVESNFERFVRAKATIDNVYSEMRNQGAEAETPSSRPASSLGRPSGHLRSRSGPFGSGASSKPPPPSSDRKKNALLKETEYGVQGIKAPLTEATAKAEEVWGPALGGREREETLKAVLASVERNRGIFEVGAAVHECVKRKDYDALIDAYRRAQQYARDATSLVDATVLNRRPLSDHQIHQVIVTARMWTDVEAQITHFKRELWRTLAGTHVTTQAPAAPDTPEEHLELIGVLLELGVEDNPIWVWLLSRYDYLKNKIVGTFERVQVEVEILRRRLGNGERPRLRQVAGHLRSAATPGRPADGVALDAPKVLEFWEHLVLSLTAVLAPRGGVLGEVIEFWDTAQSFIDGTAQRALPVGVDGQSRHHHQLSADGVADLRRGMTELIGILRDHVASFFVDAPIEDVSMLFSPVPQTPDTPRTPLTPLSATLSPTGDTRFKFDRHAAPPPSPSRGESWEKFAFWPPYATSLSGVHFLSRLLVLVGTAASEMASLRVVRDAPRATESLKTLVGGVRERCVQALCAAWNADAEHCRVMEDWTRAPASRNLTAMPARFLAFEEALLAGLQTILYVSDATHRPGAADVLVPPPAKLLQMVRSQFVTSLYKALSGMVENAERPRRLEDGPGPDDVDGLTAPARQASTTDLPVASVDATNRNVRMLLTLSNLQAIRNEVVPQLIVQFETNFSVKLTDESKTIRDVLSQIDARLFQSYVRPIMDRLTALVTAGVMDPAWLARTGRPDNARPYIYDMLLALVIVHTEVSTTAPSLTSQILKYLLEQTSGLLIELFQRRADQYPLPALMQATVDVEFMAQTLGSYTTDAASDHQSRIYLVLDERTDKDARARLQRELPELRSTLKRLRENTRGEFACFKKSRGYTRGERPPSR